MQEQHLFEYAVVRIVPKVEREEFFNVGVVLYCAKEKFLDVLFKLDEERLRAFCKKADVGDLLQYLAAFERICKGETDAGVIGKLPVAERFRWLTATRSTVVQTSKVHPGLCDDAFMMLQKLFNQLVV